MKQTIDLGKQLRKMRKTTGESLETAARAIGIDRSHLNKIELGTLSPSQELLDKILVHFSVEGNYAVRLMQLAGHQPVPVNVSIDEGKENPMAQPSSVPMAPVQQPGVQVALNPGQTPILYTDSVFVTMGEYGLILDVAQPVGGMQQAIVARVGMSFDHARKLIAIMQDQLDKNEK